MVHHLVFYLYRGVSSLFALLCHYVSFKKSCVRLLRLSVDKDGAKTEEFLLNESLSSIPTECVRPAGREERAAVGCWDCMAPE